MRVVSYLFLFLLTTALLSVDSRSQVSTDPAPCSQSTATREALMRQAEQQRFTVRRVEFLGTMYTPDEVLRRRMVTDFQEGDLFARRKLVNSLRNMSRLRSEIYPVKLKNVELRLNEPEKTVDMLICFKSKRQSPRQ
jgi:outer membrane protein assembly factor BamA